MRHLVSAQYWTSLASGNTGHLSLSLGGPVCTDQIRNCPLDRVLILQFCIILKKGGYYGHIWYMYTYLVAEILIYFSG